VSLDATTEFNRSGESALSLAVSGRWCSARGKNTAEAKWRAAHPAPEPQPEGIGSSFSGVVASELVTRPELTGLLEVGVIRFGRGTEVPRPNRARSRSSETECRPARRRGDGRMSSPRTARLRHRGEEDARATRCRAPPKRRTTRSSPSGSFHRAVPTEVVEPVRRTDRRLPHGRVPPRWDGCVRHAAGERRHLPWGSAPFGENSPGDRCVGLPDRHRPSSGFLTLSTA
jgi:hypothetical protein